MLKINGVDDLKAQIGAEPLVSDWHTVTQEDINTFADVTGDHQYIHVDPERAKQTPFGGTIAHGYYTLSLMPKFLEEILSFDGFSMGINYGCEKVRFPAPLPVGAKVRMRSQLNAVTDIPGGVQLLRTETFETDAGDKPVCVAETVTRLYL